MGKNVQIPAELLDFIEDNDIREFYDLARIAKEVNSEWFLIISSKSTVLNHYIRSRRHAKQAEEARKRAKKTSPKKALF